MISAPVTHPRGHQATLRLHLQQGTGPTPRLSPQHPPPSAPWAPPAPDPQNRPSPLPSGRSPPLPHISSQDPHPCCLTFLFSCEMNCNPHFRAQVQPPVTMVAYWRFPPFLTVQTLVGRPVTMTYMRSGVGGCVCQVPGLPEPGSVPGCVWETVTIW